MMKPSVLKKKEDRKPLKRPALKEQPKTKPKPKGADKSSVLHGFEGSRIMKNLDISEELAMSSDITFDQELLTQLQSRAAKTIQRWFKDLMQTRMMQEADRAIEQTKGLLRLKKDHLVKKHIYLRESVAYPVEAQKENFNIFAVLSQDAPSKPKPREEQAEDKEANIAEEVNKLKDLNELIKNKEFSIKQNDEEFDQFLRKLNDSRFKQSSPAQDFTLPDISRMAEPEQTVSEEVTRIIANSLSPPRKVQQPTERGSASSSVQGEKYLDLMRILEGDSESKLPTREEENPYSKSKMMELQIEKEENEKAIGLLKELRQKERVELRAAVERVKDEAENQAEQVKAQMAIRLEKQVALIEQLLADKKALSEKCEAFAEKGRDVEREKEKLRTVLEQRFVVDLKKNKDAWVAGERVRKEKWEQEKIDEIKSTTVKKLEPTIQQLIENNKDELRRTHETARQEVKHQREAISEVFERKMEELRDRLLREKDDALEKEREKAQTKSHDQFARLEAQFMEERRRWKEMADNDMDRVESSRRKEKEAMEQQLKSMQERTEKELERQRLKAEEKQEEVVRRQQVELKQAKELMRAQQEEWRDDLVRKQKEASSEHAKRVREEMVRERNREIEAIINKLGDETHDTQKSLLVQFEKKGADAAQKSRTQIEDLKSQLTLLQDKYKAEGEQRVLIEESMRVLSRRVHDLELESTERKEKLLQALGEKQALEKKLSLIYKEQATLRSQVEEEMRFEMQEKDCQLRKLAQEKASVEQRLRMDVEEVKEQNKQELEIIQEKIESALEKKNRNIGLLHEEVRSKDVQIVKLREMLEKQRRELLL